jgi:competence protein ComEC
MEGMLNRPLVCATLAFAGGIALAAAFGERGLWAVGLLVLLSLAGWAWRRTAPWAGVACLAFAAAAGAVICVLGEVQPRTDVSRLPEGGQTLVGTVAGAPRFSDGTWRFVLAAERHEQGDRDEPISGSVYVKLRTSRPVERGQRWRLTGRLREARGERNPGGRSEAATLAVLGATAMLTVNGPELAEQLGRGDLGLVASHAFAAQRRALGLLERYVSGPYRELTAGVAASVIFGVHASPPPSEITDDFRRAGTIHLLVVSGAMVSMVFGFVFLPGVLGARWRRLLAERQMPQPLTGRGRVRRWPGATAAIVGLLVVVYYAVLTEGGQAVARAAFMGVFVGLAFVLRRVPAVAKEHGMNIDHYTLVAAAALFILAMQPDSLFQPGFQLSFMAVWSLIYLTPKLEWLMPGVPRWLRLGVAGTTAAQFATFPILAWHYGQAPIGGFGANLLAVPLAGVVLTAGMATCALGVVAPLLAYLSGWVTGISTRAMIWASSEFAAVPWLSPQVARPSRVAIMAWYGGLVWVGWWLGRKRQGSDGRPATQKG